MVKTIKARFSHGVIKPLEKIDIPEGEELKVTIEEKPSKAEDESFLKAVGSWKRLIDADEIIKNIYADRLISTRPEAKL